MAYIKISDLESADKALPSEKENFLTELQTTEAQQIMGAYRNYSIYMQSASALSNATAQWA